MVDLSAGTNNRAQSIPLTRETLVLGGGIAGMTVAQSLTRLGIHVTIIEKGNEMGGNARSFGSAHIPALNCESMVDLDEMRAGLGDTTFISDAELYRLDGQFGSYKATIKKGSGEAIRIETPIVVVATGSESMQTSMDMPVAENVCFSSDLVRLLAASATDRISWKGMPIGSVAFVLDQTNEDIKIDSQNTLAQSLTLREKYSCTVCVLCKDLKVSFDGGERLYRKAREAGVLFYKYDEPPHYSRTGEKLSLVLPDSSLLSTSDRDTVLLAPDLVVIPDTFFPNKENESFCRILGIRRGEQGYLMDANPQFSPVRSNRRGIFVVGACRFPQDNAETIAAAKAAAEEVAALITPGVYEYGELVAEVDASKCALCYTCPRLCPHGAITIEKYAEGNVYREPGGVNAERWNAAWVEPAACYGCGICVAECPARAIQLRGERSLPGFMTGRNDRVERNS